MAPADHLGVTPAVELDKIKQVRAGQYLVRFALGAGVSVAAGIVGRSVGARFGGMFLAFPAILPASLTLIQDKEGTRRAHRSAIGAVLGGVGLVVFAVVGEACLGHLQPFAALLVALGAWSVVSVALYTLLAVLRPDDCDRRMD